MNTPCPPYVTMALLIELVPQVHEGTVYRWNTAAGGKKRLPPYDLVVEPAEMWTLETILGWADQNNVVLDQVRLEQIEKEQGVSVSPNQ